MRKSLAIGSNRKKGGKIRTKKRLGLGVGMGMWEWGRDRGRAGVGVAVEVSGVPEPVKGYKCNVGE